MGIWQAVLMVFLLAGVAQAEDASKDTQPTAIMDEVVVSATKTDEKRKDIPNSMVIMDAMDISESSARTLGELLNNEPGMDLSSYGNYGGASQEIHIRGMSGNGTQVFVNGVNINSPSLGTADLAMIPLNNIERVEVVKGSGSLLYGTGASGGVVNIITKGPERGVNSFSIGTGYGTDDTYGTAFEQGMFVSENFGYYLTGNIKGTDGFRDNSYLDHRDVSLKLVYDMGDIFNLSLYGDHVNRDYGLPGVNPPEYTREFYFLGTKVYNGEVQSLLDKGYDVNSHVALEAKSRPVEWLSLRVKTDFSEMENFNYTRYYSSFYYYDRLGVFAPGLPGSKTWVVNEVRTTEANAEITPVEGLSVLLGGEYRDYDWENWNIDLDGLGFRNTKTKVTEGIHSKGIYTEVQYRPCKYFKALAGVRHEDHSAFGTESVPRYGLIFNLTENTALKLNHGRHFKAPTPNDLYWPEGPYTKGNPNLKPETGWHSDVTLEQSFLEEMFFLEASYFYWDLDNKIQWGPDSNGVWTPINLKTYKADGLELGLKVKPIREISLGLSYTYLNADEQNRDYYRQDYGTPDFRYLWVTRRAAYTPERQFKGNLIYRNDMGLTATATVRYTSDRLWYRTESTTYPATKTVEYKLASFWTADIKLEQRLFDHFLLACQVNNLFEEEYDTKFGVFYNAATFASPTAYYPGAGRSVFFSATYEY